jgi:Uncharacterized protein conserved in bacteria (DUF2332)
LPFGGLDSETVALLREHHARVQTRLEALGAYSNGQSLGDPSSPVQLSSSIVGDRPIPTRAMSEVVARVGVDLDPVDVTPDSCAPAWGRISQSGSRGSKRAEAIGRCWSQGRLLAWLADLVPIDMFSFTRPGAEQRRRSR